MRNKLTDELAVCGMNAALAVSEHHPQTVNRLFLREDRLPLFTGICKQLAERKRPYKICEDEELERICKSVHHQGVVAMIEEPVIDPLSMEDLDLWADKGMTGVILHSVGNDHNLGAIARAAAFFDVTYIVLNDKDKALKQQLDFRADVFHSDNFRTENPDNAAPVTDNELRLTTSAYRVAEGAFEYLTIRSIRSTSAFLKDASRRLVTIGTDTRARMRISDLSGIVKNLTSSNGQAGSKIKINKPGSRPGIALILGNEEFGLPKDVKDKCSCLLRVPGTGNIDSLNVSQAAALFLHEIFEL